MNAHGGELDLLHPLFLIKLVLRLLRLFRSLCGLTRSDNALIVLLHRSKHGCMAQGERVANIGQTVIMEAITSPRISHKLW